MTLPSFSSDKLLKQSVPKNLIIQMGFLLNKAAQKIKSAGDQMIAPYGITTQHLGIMFFLNEFKTASQIEIGMALSIDRTSMVKMIDELESVGYVTREKDPEDRRRHKIVMTSTGKDQFEVFAGMMRELEEQFLSPLTKNRRLQLVNDLQKLVLE